MKGHVHQKLMAQYAEDAKTTDKPWELWQLKKNDGAWSALLRNPDWVADLHYRRKPKMKLIHGVEVPDISFTPEYRSMYYLADVYAVDLFDEQTVTGRLDKHWASLGLCYPYTEEGKQAAILHAKSMLGIKP